MSPSWYDVLDVEPTASNETIRSAWRTAIADLDPGDRRFRLLNQAAEVLLDPDRRAAYDAELAAIAPEPDPVPDAAAPAEPWMADLTAPTYPEPPPPLAEPEDADVARPGARVVPGWILVALAILAAVMVGLSAWQLSIPSDAAVAADTTDAQGAAERAAVTILSYDYRSLDADQQAADALMTSSYRKKYDQLFNSVIRDNAASVKPVVTGTVIASGIVRSGSDRVQILVFINRSTTNAKVTEPQVSHDQATLTMAKVDGTWLVDALDTTPAQ